MKVTPGEANLQAAASRTRVSHQPTTAGPSWPGGEPAAAALADRPQTLSGSHRIERPIPAVQTPRPRGSFLDIVV